MALSESTIKAENSYPQSTVFALPTIRTIFGVETVLNDASIFTKLFMQNTFKSSIFKRVRGLKFRPRFNPRISIKLWVHHQKYKIYNKLIIYRNIAYIHFCGYIYNVTSSS